MSFLSNVKQQLLAELYVAFHQWKERIIDVAEYEEWVRSIFERGIKLYDELLWLNK